MGLAYLVHIPHGLLQFNVLNFTLKWELLETRINIRMWVIIFVLWSESLCYANSPTVQFCHIQTITILLSPVGIMLACCAIGLAVKILRCSKCISLLNLSFSYCYHKQKNCLILCYRVDAILQQSFSSDLTTQDSLVKPSSQFNFIRPICKTKCVIEIFCIDAIAHTCRHALRCLMWSDYTTVRY